MWFSRVSWGFTVGAGLGVALALLALALADGGAATSQSIARTGGESLGTWLSTNLGHSVWLFGAVLVLYTANLTRLRGALAADAASREVVELDQLIDVWIHLFVGIGVIWTAVGMRSALQSALGDPGAALTEGAGDVLQKLVDGGILLALTTTIVGGVGGYLMRLVKTMLVGAALHEHYEETARHDISQLNEVAVRIEGHLADMSSGDVASAMPSTRKDTVDHA